MTNQGHLKRRRGIIEHVKDGRLTLQELGAHELISMMADKATGIWWGSAKALAANCGCGDVTDRQARHLLERLESAGYLKRFPRKRGRGNYPVLINKYEVTFGSLVGKRLNAIETKDWKSAVYESCQADGLADSLAIAPIQEVRRRVEKKKEVTPVSEAEPQQAKPKKAIQSLPRPQLTLGPLPEWDEFVANRLAIGKPLTPLGAQKILNRLEEYRIRGHPPGELLNRAIEGNWTGIWEPKGNGNGTRTGGQGSPDARKTRSDERRERTQQALVAGGVGRSELVEYLHGDVPGTGNNAGTGSGIQGRLIGPARRPAP